MTALAISPYAGRPRLVLAPVDNQELLAKLWLRWKQEQLLEIIFHEGVPPLNYFLSEWTSSERATLGCFKDFPDGAAELHGLCWISQTFVMLGKFRKAEIGMAFVRGSKPGEVIEWVRQAMRYAFEVRHLDSIFGCTPEPNRAAVLLGRKAGFHQVVIEEYTCFEGRLCAAVLQFMTKTEWLRRGALEQAHGREVEVRAGQPGDPETAVGSGYGADEAGSGVPAQTR